MSLPAHNRSSGVASLLIAGGVLPVRHAEELLRALPGVISARIVADAGGAVEGIHVLTDAEVSAEQTVRNVESALIAHLGVRLSQAKISVAAAEGQRPDGGVPAPEPVHRPGESTPAGKRNPEPASRSSVIAASAGHVRHPTSPSASRQRRRIYFEDVEVRRSRSRGVACRVTLRTDDQSYVGAAEGAEHERVRIELAARATLGAIRQLDGEERSLALEGCKVVEAFEHRFVFVGVTTQRGCESLLMTGSAEVRDSTETASVLAVLDATNRWMERGG